MKSLIRVALAFVSTMILGCSTPPLSERRTQSGLSDNAWAKAILLSEASKMAPKEREALFGPALAAGVDKAAIYASLGDEVHQAWVGSAVDERALVYYRKAVAADPTMKYAWLKLAILAEGPEQFQALDAVSALDPENPIPVYIRAWASMEGDDDAAFLALLAKGNAMTGCCFYEPPLPQSVDLRYPDVPFYRKLAVAGMRVPPSAISYLCRSSGSGGEHFGLHKLFSAERIVQMSERLLERDKKQAAVELLERSLTMHLRIALAEPKSSLRVISGGLNVKSLLDELTKIEPTAAKTWSEQNPVQYQELKEKANAACTGCREGKTDDEVLKEILSGKCDGGY